MFRKFCCHWLGEGWPNLAGGEDWGREDGMAGQLWQRGGGSGDSRSPPGKRSDTLCSPTSSKTSPNRFEMSDLQVEEGGEEDDYINFSWEVSSCSMLSRGSGQEEYSLEVRTSVFRVYFYFF